jgi:hypothetical protein
MPTLPSTETLRQALNRYETATVASAEFAEDPEATVAELTQAREGILTILREMKLVLDKAPSNEQRNEFDYDNPFAHLPEGSH